MKHCFVLNPAAGKGKIAAELTKKIEAACRARGVDFEVYLTTGVGDATDYVLRAAAERTEPIRFYACGGDVTLGETARGSMSLENRDGVSLGLIPVGTGNDFARNFSSKENFFDIEAQLDGEEAEMDVIKLNDDRYSMNVVNVGFDCEVVCDTVKFKKSRIIPSSLAYIAGLVVTLVRKPGIDMTISIDGGEAQKQHFLLATFANGSFYGGGFHSNPKASVVDGQIDGLLVSDITRRRFVMLVGDYKKGTHLTPKFEKILKNYKAKTVDMYFDEETNVSVDGEIVRFRELHVSILPRAIRFVIPRGSARLSAQAEEAVAATV